MKYIDYLFKIENIHSFVDLRHVADRLLTLIEDDRYSKETAYVLSSHTDVAKTILAEYEKDENFNAAVFMFYKEVYDYKYETICSWGTKRCLLCTGCYIPYLLCIGPCLPCYYVYLGIESFIQH